MQIESRQTPNIGQRETLKNTRTNKQHMGEIMFYYLFYYV